MDIRYKAKDKLGHWAEGYYVKLYSPNFDKAGNIIDGYHESHEFFNDSPGNRLNSYWTTIEEDTLCIYIGKRDEFLKPIYTNDFVRLTSTSDDRVVIGIVAYNEQMASFCCLVNPETSSNAVNDMVVLNSDLWVIEVIGNRFD